MPRTTTRKEMSNMEIVFLRFFFFDVDHFFKSLSKSVLYCFMFGFFFGHKACGILVP